LKLTYTLPKSRKAAQTATDAAQWLAAWNHELDTLEKRGTVQFVPLQELPANTKLLPTTIVLKFKHDEQGKPYARIVRCNIRVDRQQPNVHYNPHAISCPVAEKETVRIILALAANHGHEAHHWDLNAAFLRELLTTNIPLYIQQPRDLTVHTSTRAIPARL